MKLLAAHIHNFRGILEQQIVFKDYTLLVGPNNSGKSTVLDALRAFYEKDYKFDSQDFPLFETSDKESWIDLTFALTDDEWASLADSYKGPKQELRVRKWFETSTKTHDNKGAKGSIFGYRKDGSLSNEPFYGAKNVQSGKFGDLIYIPAISKVDEHAKLTGPSVLRDLLSDILGNVVESGNAYGQLSDAVSTFAGAVREERTNDGRSLAAFEDELNSLLRSWQTRFSLDFPVPSAVEIIKSMVNWKLTDERHGCAQDIDHYGSGFQRYFIYSLIQLGTRYIGKKSEKKDKDFRPSLTLVLFEEPEAFLHPPQQKILAQNLRQLSQQTDWQVVCATHSPYFVSRNVADIPAIVHLRRPQTDIQISQISKSDWEAIVDANQAINKIASNYPKLAKKLSEEDMKPEIEALKYIIWLNPDRCSAFFADHVLLVEGATEVALINRLVDDGRIANAPSGFYVMDCIGKFNIHRFMNLFNHLGIFHSVLYDDDNNQEEHAEINQLIKNSKGEFTCGVVSVPGKLEDFLELPSPGESHRKPQHALYHYDRDINTAKLDQLCDLIKNCLSGNWRGNTFREETSVS